jgi:branched-chain amino acid transport system ATP-binding protein
VSGEFRAEHLSRRFGGLRVTNDVSLSLGRGERIALIGPNGAGKTTLINMLAGRISPDEGRMWFADAEITSESAVARVRMGIVRTFQVTRLFPEMTAMDHVLLAVLQQKKAATRLLARFDGDRSANEEASAIVARLGLGDRSGRQISQMPYGEQRLVEIAIALALKPRVLLLDEPAAGVPSAETHLIERALEHLPKELAVLMIEHDMDFVFRFARRVIVLNEGAIIFEGDPAAVSSDPEVRKAYLGSYANAGRSS